MLDRVRSFARDWTLDCSLPTRGGLRCRTDGRPPVVCPSADPVVVTVPERKRGRTGATGGHPYVTHSHLLM